MVLQCETFFLNLCKGTSFFVVFSAVLLRCWFEAGRTPLMGGFVSVAQCFGSIGSPGRRFFMPGMGSGGAVAQEDACCRRGSASRSWLWPAPAHRPAQRAARRRYARPGPEPPRVYRRAKLSENCPLWNRHKRRRPRSRIPLSSANVRCGWLWNTAMSIDAKRLALTAIAGKSGCSPDSRSVLGPAGPARWRRTARPDKCREGTDKGVGARGA